VRLIETVPAGEDDRGVGHDSNRRRDEYTLCKVIPRKIIGKTKDIGYRHDKNGNCVSDSLIVLSPLACIGSKLT